MNKIPRKIPAEIPEAERLFRDFVVGNWDKFIEDNPAFVGTELVNFLWRILQRQRAADGRLRAKLYDPPDDNDYSPFP